MGDYRQLLDPQSSEERVSKTHSHTMLSDEGNEEGLTSDEASLRLFKNGPNQIKEPEQRESTKLLKCFWGPMPVLIWSASLIELIRLSPVNLSFLLVLQLVNGLVWYLEDKNSANALNTIKKNLSPMASVKRNGVWIQLNSIELVVGDRIQLSSGDLIPADCILGNGECLIDQSMLTGEISPVVRIEGSKVYMGSICKKGEIEAQVIATGIDTFFGRSNLLSGDVNRKGKIELIFGKIAFLLLIVSTILVSIILIILLVKNNEFLESMSNSLVLMILSLPIAMQAVCASILSVGAKLLNKKHALVCRLSSIEQLASVEILCLHKSKIFTKGEPAIHSSILIQSASIEDLFLTASFTSRRDTKNYIDKCICEYANGDLKISWDGFEEEDYLQYDPKSKRTEAIIRNIQTGEVFKCCKGAPQMVLSLTKEQKYEEEVGLHVIKLASQGYSVVAVAKTDQRGIWRLQGLISIFDPFFEGVNSQLTQIKEMNIKSVLLTGDNLAISKQICNHLNLGDMIFNAEIFNSDMTTVQRELIDSVLLNADGFAEVFPEHKFTIVKMMQNKKKKVGITGHSISDAASLQRANVGLASFGANDAAKAAADIIFTQPGLNIILRAIKKARKIFRKAKTYCEYRISCSFQLLFFFFVSLMAINPKTDFKCEGSTCNNIPNTFALPVIALVIIALLNDATIISISHDRADLLPNPCKWNLSKIFIVSCTLGAISFFSSLAFTLISLSHMNESKPNMIFQSLGIPVFHYEEVLTLTFLKVSLSNYLTIFTVRTNRWIYLSLPGLSIILTGLSAMIITSLLCRYWFLNVQPKNSVIIASLHPISWEAIAVVWVFSLAILILQDLAKMCIEWIYYPKAAGQSKQLIKMCLGETQKNYQSGLKNHLEHSKISAQV